MPVMRQGKGWEGCGRLIAGGDHLSGTARICVDLSDLALQPPDRRPVEEEVAPDELVGARTPELELRLCRRRPHLVAIGCRILE
eukprot:7084149-Prymnesium_polylepis.1